MMIGKRQMVKSLVKAVHLDKASSPADTISERRRE